MIKNIIFDIGNVCVDFCYRDFFESFGFSREIVDRICLATAEDPAWDLGDGGQVTEEELLEIYISNDPEIEPYLRKVYESFDGIIRERKETIPWLIRLREKGYGVYYLSNYPSKVERECRDHMKFLEYMDGGILSYKVKMIKPYADIYEKLLADYGLKAEECLFLDDKPVNCAGAEAVGMKAIVFTTKEEVEKKMAELGI